MSNFVDDNTSLPTPKVDLNPLEPGQDGTRYVQASDWNTVCQAALDLRTAVKLGLQKAYALGRQIVLDGVNSVSVKDSSPSTGTILEVLDSTGAQILGVDGITNRVSTNILSSLVHAKTITDQTTAGSSLAIPAGFGDVARVTMASNITGWNILGPWFGQHLTIEFIQNATGGFTLAGPNASIHLVSAFTPSTAANSISILRLFYDTVSGKVIEISRNTGIV